MNKSISDVDKFMALKEGDEIPSTKGAWKVASSAVKTSSTPYILAVRPGQEIPELIYYDPKQNVFFDEIGCTINELNDEMHIRV